MGGGEAGKGRPLATWPKLAAFIHPPPSLQNTTGDGVCVCSRARVFELLLCISLNEGFQKVPFLFAVDAQYFRWSQGDILGWNHEALRVQTDIFFNIQHFFLNLGIF